MKYEIDKYGLVRNVLASIVLMIGIFSNKWEFAFAYILYSINVSLVDICANMSKDND